MKLLFLLQDWPYPPSNGYRQKVFNLISYMGQKHQCDVLALGTPEDLQRSSQWLRQIPGLRVLGIFPPDQVPWLRIRQLGMLLFSSNPPSWLRYLSHALERAIDCALAQETYDLVHIDLQGMAQYCQRLGKLRKVLSLNDAMSLTLFGAACNRFAPLQFRLSAFLRALPQMRIDRALCQLADAVHFVGAVDADWFKKRFRASTAIYVPLAVESGFLQVERKIETANDNPKMIIIDKLWAAQHRNAVSDFLSKYWMALHAKYSSLRLIIIGGRGMPNDFQEYAANLPGVELHEWVDQLEDTLAQTTIALFPYSVQVGMKTRVIQCMAAMNAVIGTPNAFLGLPARHMEHVFIGKNQKEIADGVEKLLESPSLCAQMGRNARSLVEMKFTPEIVGKSWERLYEDVSKGKTLHESYELIDVRKKL